MTPQKVKPGDVLTIPVYYGVKNKERHIISYTEFVVEKVYPNFVLAFDGNFYECFTFGQLVQMGLEDGHNKEFSHGTPVFQRAKEET